MQYKKFSPMSWRKHDKWNADVTSLQLETLRCSQCPSLGMRWVTDVMGFLVSEHEIRNSNEFSIVSVS